jgi:hypothetical protein
MHCLTVKKEKKSKKKKETVLMNDLVSGQYYVE